MFEKDSSKRILVKYIRKYLFDMFDVFYQKSEFQHIFIEDFPERIISRGVQYKKRLKIDINEDFDVLFEEFDVEVDGDVDGVVAELSNFGYDG